MIEPFISIVIPTYNRSKIISRAINSILNQTYQNFECLVVDDFSTDDTKKLIATHQEQDSRIRYILNERKKGAQGARNTGVLNAKGEWVVFFDSDDFMGYKFLESTLSKAIENKADVCTCFINMIEHKTNKKIGFSEFRCCNDTHKMLMKGKCYVYFNNAIIKKNKIFEIGLLDEDCPSHQEKDTHFQLSKISKYITVEEYLVDYYTGSSDTISSNKDKHIDGLLYILVKHGFYWRLKSYRGYIQAARRIMEAINDFSDPKLYHYKRKLYGHAPDLLLVLWKNKLKRLVKSY